jgi:uncharacterized protein (TIGR03067 family)
MMRFFCLLVCFVPADEAAPRDELKGTWTLVKLELPEMREDFVPAFEDDVRFTFEGGKLTIASEGKPHLYQLNPRVQPNAVDVAGGSEYLGRDRQLLGIYEVKGDTARLCLRPASAGRPENFAAGRLLILNRVK